jgi:hypothetical protein
MRAKKKKMVDRKCKKTYGTKSGLSAGTWSLGFLTSSGTQFDVQRVDAQLLLVLANIMMRNLSLARLRVKSKTKRQTLQRSATS